MNQDVLGVQGRCVKDCCSHGSTGGILSPYTCYHFSHSWQVWTGPLEGGHIAVVVVNRFDKEEAVEMDWSGEAGVAPGRYRLEDLWTGEVVEEVVVGEDRWRGRLQAHDNWAFRLSPL